MREEQTVFSEAHLCYWHTPEIERFFHLFPLDLHNPEISEVLYIPRKHSILSPDEEFLPGLMLH